MRLLLFLITLSLPAQTVIAHRGGKAHRPENTMAAFRHALANFLRP
jgi:glycerophosphoryl diester phosphodiesterase